MTEYDRNVCLSCDHREVCRLSEEFVRAQNAVNNVTVPLGSGRMMELRNFHYIEPVQLKCKHWKLESVKGGVR